MKTIYNMILQMLVPKLIFELYRIGCCLDEVNHCHEAAPSLASENKWDYSANIDMAHTTCCDQETPWQIYGGINGVVRFRHIMKEDMHYEITTTVKVSFTHNIYLNTIIELMQSDYDIAIHWKKVSLTKNVILLLLISPLLPLNKFYTNATSWWRL